MDTQLATTIISTGGAVIVGAFGMFFTANQIGRRIDDSNKRIDDSNNNVSGLRQEVRDLRNEFTAFKDLVNSKFASLDLEIAKLMDRIK